MAQVKTRAPSFSTPLPGAKLYHPAGKVIVALVFAPFLATTIAAGAFVAQGAPIPFELPAALAAWALLVPVFWRGMQTVRTTEGGIAAGRPWQAWREIAWSDVTRVERHGLRMHVVSSQGTRIKFTPLLLHDGGQLRNGVLLPVPPAVAQGRLAEVAVLVHMTAAPASGGERPEPLGKVALRPRARLRLGAALAVLVALAAGGFSVVALPIIFGVALAACALVIAGVGVVAFGWLSQVVTLSDAGITVQALQSARTRGTLWANVVVLEHTGSWGALRLTNKVGERVTAPGPGVMRPLDAEAYQLYFERLLYNREHGVLVAQRHWLF